MRELLRRRAGQTGLLVAASAIPYTFQRTLAPRSDADQALVTGLSFLLTETSASALQELVQIPARLLSGDVTTEAGARRWSRRSIVADLATAGAGVGIQRYLAARPGETTRRAAGRTTGWMASVVGSAGAMVGVGHEAARVSGVRMRFGGLAVTGAIAGGVAGLREYSRRRAEQLDEGSDLEPSQTSVLRSLALAAAVTAGSTVAGHAESLLADRTARLAARLLPGDETVWRPVGHAAVLGTVGWAGRVAAARMARIIEGREKKTEPALDVPPLAAELSGGPGSHVAYETMSRMGRRFVWTSRSPREIARITGEASRAYPVRVYVGLEAAPTEDERVALALAELERTAAWERSWLLVCSPTGTGYVNYAAAGAMEFLSRGDCTTLAMQYSQRPSPLSLDRVKYGREQFAALVGALSRRLAAIPVEERPRVVVFGESLGAWTSQDAFLGRGTEGLVASGIDHAIWIGTPHGSKWKDQVLAGGPGVDPAMVAVCDNIGNWEAMDPERRDAVRYLMISHTNDGVVLFGPELLVQQPSWLGPSATRPPRVPRGQRWIPITTFVQTLIDTKNAARVVPGRFDADGHDYRADIVPFFDALLGFGADPAELARITEALEHEEATRTEWIAEHGKVGNSMAAVVLAEVRESHPAAFSQAVEAVRRRRGSAAPE